MILKGFLGTVVLAALAAGTAISVVGFDSAITTVAASRDRAREAWEDTKARSSRPWKSASGSSNCGTNGRGSAEPDSDRSDARKPPVKAKRVESELEQEEELLARGRLLLASPKDEFVIGGRTYAPADVSEGLTKEQISHRRRLPIHEVTDVMELLEGPATTCGR